MSKVAFNAGVFFGSPLYPATTSCSIAVTEAESGLAATLYSSRAGAGQSNPFNISSAGIIEFYADPGRYSVVATVGANSQTWSDVILAHSSIEPLEKTASYTITAADHDLMIVVTGASAVNLTIPAEATEELNTGFIVHVTHMGTGVLTIVEDTGVTVNLPAAGTLVIPSGGTVSIYYPKLTTDLWKMFGQVVAA